MSYKSPIHLPNAVFKKIRPEGSFTQVVVFASASIKQICFFTGINANAVSLPHIHEGDVTVVKTAGRCPAQQQRNSDNGSGVFSNM